MSSSDVAIGTAEGVFPSQALTEAIEAAPQLNAVITTCPDAALERARGRLDGPLAGVPLLVKDIFVSVLVIS